MYPAVSLAGMKAAGMAAAETGVGAMEMPTVAPFLWMELRDDLRARRPADPPTRVGTFPLA
jgi:hypothetical protein